MLYILIIYTISFYIIFVLTVKAMKWVTDSLFSEAFYMLAAFALCKASATTIEIMASTVAGMKGSILALSLSSMISVVANVFLFQTALTFLLYNSSIKTKFRVIPLILFAGYLLLYISGLIKVEEVDKLGRLSFGYNSGILNSIAMFHLYYVKKEKAFGFMVGGIGFVVYSIFEGIIFTPVLGVDHAILRMTGALMLLTSSFSLVSLLQGKKLVKKVGYI